MTLFRNTLVYVQPHFCSQDIQLELLMEMYYQVLEHSINQSSIFQDYYKRYIQVIVKSQWLIVAVVIQGQT